MTARPILAALALATLAAATPAGACGWWGESVGEKPPESVTTNKSDLAKLDTSTPEGMAQMAHAYRLGQGVPQDDLVARRWMTRAARAGDAGAMNDLGQMFEMGIGGPEDQAGAARWYGAAAEAGIAQAQHSLALMLFEGRGVARDSARAGQLLRGAAQAGHATAAADLAFRIWAGDIAPQAPHEGCLWSLVAGRLGANGGAETCRRQEVGLSEDALSSLAKQAAAIVRTSGQKGQS